MTEKKKRASSRSIWKFLEWILLLMRLFRGVWDKIKTETIYTIRNSIFLLILGLMLACLLTATWISLLGFLFFALLQWQWTWYAAAGLVMCINFVFLLILCVSIMKVKNKLNFLFK